MALIYVLATLALAAGVILFVRRRSDKVQRRRHQLRRAQRAEQDRHWHEATGPTSETKDG